MTANNGLIDIDGIGIDFVESKILNLTDHVEHMEPVAFNEKHRYFARGETSHPGLMNFDITPYWIEPLNQLDPYSPTREIAIKKGVKTSFNSTAIEGGLLYFAAHLKAFPGMFVTADKEMAQSRMKTHIIPMFQQSGFGEIFRSGDQDSSGKTGKTKELIEWLGGGKLIPEGAKNADKMRMYLAMWMWLDELDSMAQSVGKDGDPIALLKDRCTTFWKMRKIMMGSTPLWKGSSHIDRQFNRGDQRQYYCNCLKCGYPMPLRWQHADLNSPDVKRGMRWDYKDDGTFDFGSIRYECWNCGRGHEEDERELFINKNNCEWKAEAIPVEPGIVSYHMPAAISRLQPWSKLVGNWHEAYGVSGKVKNVEKLQWFYNNVLGSSFELIGQKLSFQAASMHRRTFYNKGQVPNSYAEMYCQSGIMCLLMTVDVQHHFLSVAVWGFCVGTNPWLIEYKEVPDDSELGCKVLESPAWVEVQRMIDEESYTADGGATYWIENTFIDAGDGNTSDAVYDFCGQYDYGVYPTKGDSHSSKRDAYFMEYKTSSKATAYMIAVDHYKDRMAPILRRQWQPEFGDQDRYQFNAPSDIEHSELKQLTVEYKREEKQKNGNTLAKWYRPKGVQNELWDLLIMAMCGIEILALNTCLGNLELEATDWPAFWEACQDEQLFFDAS